MITKAKTRNINDATTQCQDDRRIVAHHPASKRFLNTPMNMMDLLGLLKYQLGLAWKGMKSNDLLACDIRYYVQMV